MDFVEDEAEGDEDEDVMVPLLRLAVPAYATAVVLAALGSAWQGVESVASTAGLATGLGLCAVGVAPLYSRRGFLRQHVGAVRGALRLGEGAQPPLDVSVPVAAAALAVSAFYVFVLGPGVHFH